ncbi:MAG: hypothetical protein ACYCT7_00375 [bacterium]
MQGLKDILDTALENNYYRKPHLAGGVRRGVAQARYFYKDYKIVL